MFVGKPKAELRMCSHDKHSHRDRALHISSSDYDKEHSHNLSLSKWCFPAGGSSACVSF